MLAPFKVGQKVKTNQRYYDLFRRTVYGTVVEPPAKIPTLRSTEFICLVRWDHQTGNKVPEHQGNVVVMTTDSLEKVLM